jgi:hypothetical protein
MIGAQSLMERTAETCGLYLARHGAELEGIDAEIDPVLCRMALSVVLKDGRAAVSKVDATLLMRDWAERWRTVCDDALALPAADPPMDGLASDGWWRDVPQAVREAVRRFARWHLIKDPNASDLEIDRMIASLNSAKVEALIEKASAVFRPETVAVGLTGPHQSFPAESSGGRPS